MKFVNIAVCCKTTLLGLLVFGISLLDANCATFSVLHEFQGADGATPVGGLLVDANQVIYGTTYEEGQVRGGTLFKIENGQFSTLHQFGTETPDVRASRSTLISDGQGNIYGTGSGGGGAGLGVVFKWNSTAGLKVIKEFSGIDGALPFGGLVRDNGGVLYGSTFYGGHIFGSADAPLGFGSIFRITPDGTFTQLHSFNGADGYGPQHRLDLHDGFLYGGTVYGQPVSGNIFRITPAGQQFSVVKPSAGDGYNFVGGMVSDQAGNLYGAVMNTSVGGIGAIYKIDRAGTYQLMHKFTGPDGAYPSSELLLIGDRLFGTTNGLNNFRTPNPANGGFGTVFELNIKTNVLTTLQKFNGPNGANPATGLTVDSTGNLIGAAQYGGQFGKGVIFRIANAVTRQEAAMYWDEHRPLKPVDVLTSRYDNERTGANLLENILTSSNVKPGVFSKLFEYKVGTDKPAHIYAQPLYVSSVETAIGVRDLLVVATMGNELYAFDGQGPREGEQFVWKQSFGTPVSVRDIVQPEYIGPVLVNPANNIIGTIGIESTPVIDRNRGVIFVVSKSIAARSENLIRVRQDLHAVDLRTGALLHSTEIRATSGSKKFSAGNQNQRAGLTLSNGQVVIAWASHEDQNDWHGWMMSFTYDPQIGFIRTGVFNPTTAGWGGGIWQSGRSPAVAPDGRVFVFTGNGEPHVVNGQRNYTNALISLNPVALRVLSYFMPSEERSEFLSCRDLDFGGGGPMIIPNTRWIVGGGKEGRMYVWDYDNLGGAGSKNTEFGVVQQFFAGEQIRTCDTAGIHGWLCLCVLTPHYLRAGHIMSGPVYWNRSDASGGAMMYIWPEDNNLRGFRVHPDRNPPIDEVPILSSHLQLQGHPGGTLTLSSNGDRRDSGIVWASRYIPTREPVGDDVGAKHQILKGRLDAYSAHDLRLIWSSSEDWDYAKFVPPTVANGKVYMATFSNKIIVYGLLPQDRIAPTVRISPVEIVNMKLRATVSASDPVTGNPLVGKVTISGSSLTVPKNGISNLQHFSLAGTTGMPMTFAACYALRFDTTDCSRDRKPPCVKKILPAACAVDVDIPGWVHTTRSISSSSPIPPDAP